MNITETHLNGVFEIQNKKLEDQRGLFVKTFHENTFQEHGLEFNFKESFYSVSKKDVLRGMHYQLPPHDHAKLVYVTDGEVLDVALDIRKESETYGKFYSTVLSSENAKSLYMAKGFAHGFLTLSESVTVVYLTSTTYSPESDRGVSWDSFGFDWEGVIDPLISARDKGFSGLDSLSC